MLIICICKPTPFIVENPVPISVCSYYYELEAKFENSGSNQRLSFPIVRSVLCIPIRNVLVRNLIMRIIALFFSGD